mmetsp:Transcript_22478/g.52499  ORF Transcript_22478/g.52499 Transcript_22478/m.52499 type:complete len:261 (+) Transcript_22478:1297-2079(+)
MLLHCEFDPAAERARALLVVAQEGVVRLSGLEAPVNAVTHDDETAGHRAQYANQEQHAKHLLVSFHVHLHKRRRTQQDHDEEACCAEVGLVRAVRPPGPPRALEREPEQQDDSHGDDLHAGNSHEDNWDESHSCVAQEEDKPKVIAVDLEALEEKSVTVNEAQALARLDAVGILQDGPRCPCDDGNGVAQGAYNSHHDKHPVFRGVPASDAWVHRHRHCPIRVRGALERQPHRQCEGDEEHEEDDTIDVEDCVVRDLPTL